MVCVVQLKEDCGPQKVEFFIRSILVSYAYKNLRLTVFDDTLNFNILQYLAIRFLDFDIYE